MTMDWKVVAVTAAMAGGLAGAAHGAGLKAEIVRTAYGIPHITAPDFAGLGYGAGYAYAQDNLCLLANELVTVNGERSKYFGADAQIEVAFSPVRNLDSDVFFKTTFDVPSLRRGSSRTSADSQALKRGWVAGYNRYLRDTPPERRPKACATAPWVRAMTEDDVLRLEDYRARLMSSDFMLRWIATAKPPGLASTPKPTASLDLQQAAEGFGSNGWAFGREVTANGSGLLVGNPHVPWSGGIRFYEIHLTVPGKLDVMGVMNAGGPVVTMGFNRDVAWTHTIAAGPHFTVFELTLDPTDPTAYLVDGKRLAMQRTAVAVAVADRAQAEVRTLYSSIYGPVIVTPFTPWTSAHAYALADANRGNQREDDTWLAMARAHSVGELRVAIARTTGLAWVNTIAADRHGEVLYADIAAVPNISAEKLKTCAPTTPGLPQSGAGGIFFLDGARSACAWDVAPDAVARGLMPASAMPATVRADYVANSNDSYWLANPKAPFPVFSQLLGRTPSAQGPRTRAGLTAIAQRLDGSDGLGGRQVDPEKAKAMLYANRNYVADLVLDDLLAGCAAKADLAPACAVLAKWDRRMNPDSAGAVLFMEFWRRASAIPNAWRVPFNAADPVGTPRGLSTDGATRDRVLQAMSAAVEQMRSQSLALDVRLADVQVVVDGSERIPIHGGPTLDGVLNAIETRFDAAARAYLPYSGSSFIQVVTFDDHGPVADAVLTHSESSDPASPHFADQTRLYSRKAWVRLPFLKADVAAQAEGPPLRIAQ
jgi:acyl-homoserine-lactone acylase